MLPRMGQPIPVENVGQAAPGSRDELLRALVRQAQRYHFASLQDQNLIVAARHNAYATGIIGVVIEQADEEEIQKIMGISLKDLKTEIYKMQDRLEGEAFKIMESMKG